MFLIFTRLVYTLFQERLQGTTKVYFKCGDFSAVGDLEALYHDLNTTHWREKLDHGKVPLQNKAYTCSI